MFVFSSLVIIMYYYWFLRQPATSTADIVTRRSLIGSVEDDPFVSAHYGSEEKKKNKARGIVH